ncbi:MAG: hypothetical protein ABJB93_09880 [Gaiellales bacterium]
MELGVYVENLRRELALAADAGGDEARALAERLVAPLESSVRLTLLEVLSAAADEITRDMAPGSVQVRLRGREPAFVVTTPPAEPAVRESPPEGQADATDGATARINFRPPEGLKVRIEEAAGREGLSVNAWLVRAATAALSPGEQGRGRSHPAGDRVTGWVG